MRFPWARGAFRYRAAGARGSAPGMTPADDTTLSDATWLRLLARRADDAGLSPLYGPLLQPQKL